MHTPQSRAISPSAGDPVTECTTVARPCSADFGATEEQTSCADIIAGVKLVIWPAVDRPAIVGPCAAWIEKLPRFALERARTDTRPSSRS